MTSTAKRIRKETRAIHFLINAHYMWFGTRLIIAERQLSLTPQLAKAKDAIELLSSLTSPITAREGTAYQVLGPGGVWAARPAGSAHAQPVNVGAHALAYNNNNNNR